MKRVMKAIFVVATAVAVWSGFSVSETEKNSTLRLADVDAITQSEVSDFHVFCQKPAGLCWKRDRYGECTWSGSMRDHCS